MFLETLLSILVILIGLILYKISHYYCYRHLGFNADDHQPICTPGSSSSSILVCILGWGGCKRRQLKRLIDFYASHNITTVSWINPMYNYLFGIDSKQIERLLDFILHENRTSKKILIHLHSNNGAVVWASMLNIMKTNQRYGNLLINVKGVIFDSAPFVYPDNSSNWIISTAIGASYPCVGIILNRAQYIHFIWTPLISYYLIIRYVYRRYFTSDSLLSAEIIKNVLSKAPIDIKQYYLYSDSDRLIPSRVIEQFMAKQMERGVEIGSHRFSGSGHVNHFRLHPSEYGAFILKFMDKL